jgi:hypothetical protein
MELYDQAQKAKEVEAVKLIKLFCVGSTLYDRGMRPRVVVMYVTNNDLFEDVPGLPYGRYYS